MNGLGFRVEGLGLRLSDLHVERRALVSGIRG